MKGQISRDSFRPRKRYSGVFQTQGAMVTDADLDEKQRIAKEQLDRLGEDAIGDGVPKTGGAVSVGAGDNPPPELRAGVIYADGVRGVLTRSGAGPLAGPLEIFTRQADLPLGPALPGGHLVIYADIWERPVFALEDGYLADAGLHGAETAFRTRTMTQLKAIRTAVPDAQHDEPMTADQLDAVIAGVPRIGTARLAVTPPDPETQIDECDPCADVVTAEQTVANALWRLEVIAVDGPPTNPTRLELAWSIENGAAIAPADVEHEAFERAGKVYEFFSTTTESHRGVFDDSGDARRPAFVDDLSTTPNPATDHGGGDWPFVRRWDGWADVDLTAGTASTLGDGFTLSVAGTTIELTVDAFTASLELGGEAVVAGDYWLVELRSFAAPADRVRLVRALPVGIQHNYCALIAVHDGAAVAVTDSQNRRLTFPALEDLPATHVGFANSCPKLYNQAENVQEALDELCSISAEDIAFDSETCPRLYNGADNVHDALANLCDVDFSTDRLLRLLHDWGVICGIVPRTVKSGSGLVTITAGSFLDRAGHIGSFKGRQVDLNKLPQEQIHFPDQNDLRRALRKGEVCLALALGEGGKITVHLAPKGLAFGPADPTYQQRVKTCVAGKRPIQIADKFKELSAGDSAVAEKMFLVANKQKSFAGSARLTNEEAGQAKKFNQALLAEYRQAANEVEIQQLEGDWRAIEEEVGVVGSRGATREVRQMQLHSRQLGALLKRDQSRALRCACDLLFPSCPPELGDPPFFVPIACLTGSFDVEILIDEVCPFCCRKQAMTWRAVQYFFGDWRDTVARSLAERCCHPKEPEDPQQPPIDDFVYQPGIYEKFDFTRFDQQFKLRDSLVGPPPENPADYRARVPVEKLSAEEAKRALAGNGVEIVDEIDLDDGAAFDRIREKTIEVEAADRLADDGKVRPGDKVALLVRDGVATDYVVVERGSKYLYDKPPAVAGKAIERPTITAEETRRFEVLVASAKTARGSLDELETRRESLTGGVSGLESEIGALELERQRTTAAVAAARTELRELTESQAEVKAQLDSNRAEAERAKVDAERTRTELDTTRTRITAARKELEEAAASLESAKVEMESSESQRKEIIGSLRSNQPAISVAGDRQLAATLAEEGIHFVGDIAEMSAAKSTDLVRRRVLTRAQVTNLQRDAKTFVAVRG